MTWGYYYFPDQISFVTKVIFRLLCILLTVSNNQLKSSFSEKKASTCFDSNEYILTAVLSKQVEDCFKFWGLAKLRILIFSNFPACFSIPIFFSNLNYNCSNFLDMINLQEQVKKALCYQKLFWPCTVWINCSSDLKKFSNSRPSASNFKSFSRLLEQFFLTESQNNFGNKIPFFMNYFLS